MNRKFHFTKATRKSLTDFLRGKSAPAAEAAPARLPLACAALTHVGRVRKVNQDVLVVSDALQLYGVADGMGGHKGGETASAGCRDAVLEALANARPGVKTMQEAIRQANTALFHQQQEDENLSGMGTTLSLIWFDDARVYLAHVGDSRVYCLRDGELQQMTDDHSFVAELMRQGLLTPEQAEKHPMRNVITRAVGTEEGIEIDLATETRRAGDIWLVCSDGLYGMMDEADMAVILRENAPEKAAELLVEAALAGGGRDNISVVVLHDKEGAR